MLAVGLDAPKNPCDNFAVAPNGAIRHTKGGVL